MIITTVTEQYRESFQMLAPEELMKDMGLDGHYCIGAIDSDGMEECAVGILLFDAVSELQEDEYVPTAVIQWLYVDQDFRNRGIGNALMERLYEILNQVAIKSIRCDVPMGPEYNQLCGFLENWNLRFSLRDVYEVTVTLGEIITHSVFDVEIGVGRVHFFNSFPEREFDGLVDKMLQQLGLETFGEKAEYDKDISCIFQWKGKLKGILFIQCKPSGILEVLQFFCNCQGELGYIQLFCESMRKAVEKYGEKQQIHIVCRNEQMAKLIAFLFPDKEPLLVRRGIYV